MLSTLVNSNNYGNRIEIDFRSYDSSHALEHLSISVEYSAGDGDSSIA